MVACRSTNLQKRLVEGFSSSFHVSAGLVEVKGDVGCVEFQPGNTLEQLLVKSDNAMYQMKYTRAHESPELPDRIHP